MPVPSHPPTPSPAPDGISDECARLRRQLILAQVQLMALEDTRDDLTTQLGSGRDLLAQTQQLADQALVERDRTTAALRERETALAAQQTEAAALRTALASASDQEKALAVRLAESMARLATEDRLRRDAEAHAAALAARVAELETERQAMKASRSWRYTAPLRSLERALRRRGGSSA